jgi:hypothetical protein
VRLNPACLDAFFEIVIQEQGRRENRTRRKKEKRRESKSHRGSEEEAERE